MERTEKTYTEGANGQHRPGYTRVDEEKKMCWTPLCANKQFNLFVYIFVQSYIKATYMCRPYIYILLLL